MTQAEPVFLVGSERSGTTLLRLMLDSHPEIAFGEEFEYAVEPIGDDGGFPPLGEYRRYLETNRIFSTSGFTVGDATSYPELVDGFLRQRREAKGAPAVGATIHFAFSKALAVWPDARFIHLVRDPRDVARSCMAMGWAGNAWFGLDKWLETEDEWAALEPLLRSDRWIEVRFADLVTDYEATLIRICRFVGVDYTGAMLDYTYDTEYDKPQPAAAGDWRSTMSERDVRLVEARLGDRLAAAGFEPSGPAPLRVDGRQLQFLRWHDRFGRVRSRVDTYGLGLTVADLAARLSGREKWRRAVRLRFNEIEKAARRKSWSDDADGRSSV